MTFIVAEIGANWRGNIVVLDRMVSRCKEAGCDAVKLQALSRELIARHPEWSWYSQASVTQDNVDMIDKVCKSNDIEWFCTPTYPEAIGFLDKYVKLYKIRHADNRRKDIIEQVLRTGKRVFLSTDRPIEDYKDIEQITQIYCIPKYPTAWGELNFDMLRILHGYSNHCLDALATLKAVHCGAKYIEFHITDNRDDFAIDNKVSFSYSQMEEIIRWIRAYDKYGI